LKLLSKNEELCTGCKTCQITCSKTYFKCEDIQKSAVSIDKDEATGKFKINACNQCGNCIRECSAMALYRAKNDIVRIKKESCVGCYSCVGFCPTLSMFYHDSLTEPFKCVACGACVKACPTGALFMEEVKFAKK
jgi:Fe-S-cluster-containing hydrogenase component 2